jgi:pimeloyl-ACP methyl ester carboxylesterase
MIWFALILLVIFAAPFVIENRRRVMDDVARGSAPGQFVELSGGVTHFQWHGPANGPLVVCVHGLTTPSFVWGGITRGLALSGYRVLTYDLYGRGFSSRPKGAQGRSFFFKQLNEVLDSQGIDEEFTLIGYSMGGAIAAAFAATYPARVHQLILLAPAGMGIWSGKLVQFIKETPLIGDWLFLLLSPRLLRKGLRAEVGLASSVPDITALQAAEIGFKGFLPAILASRRGILSEPLEADHRELAARGIPVLAIWGRDDVVIPISAVGVLATWNRDAHQEVIDGAGHGLPYSHTDMALQIMGDWMT